MKLLLTFFLCNVVLGTNAKSLRLTNTNTCKLGEFPYQVSIRLDGIHQCGGTLISKQHILTAAHCVSYHVRNKTPKSRIKIALGTINIKGGTLMDVERISHHKDFRNSLKDPATFLQADVALIKMKNPVTFTKYIQPIKLPEANKELPAGTELLVTGFGSSVMRGPNSSVLKKLKLYVVNHDACKFWWRPTPLVNGVVCANYAPGFGVCQGDSGGPVTIDGKTLIGIVSATHGSGCGTGIPDIITKVTTYLPYIREEMKI